MARPGIQVMQLEGQLGTQALTRDEEDMVIEMAARLAESTHMGEFEATLTKQERKNISQVWAQWFA